MKKNQQNNIIKFPALLGARFRATTSKQMDVENIDNYIFYGDKIVLKMRNVVPTVYDMWLFFQLMERFQKERVEIVESIHTFEDEEVSLQAKEELKNKLIEQYKRERNLLPKEEFIEFIKTKIKEELEIRRNYISSNLYQKTKKAICMKVSITELVKDRGLSNSIMNRETIFNSLERLAGVGLTWFVLSDELSNEIKEIKKKHKGVSEFYLPEVKTHFEKRKYKSNIYIRNLLESADINREMTTAIVKLEEGFFNMSMNSKSFDFSILKNIKGNMAKTLYVNLNFAFKPVMTKEYLYDILCLSVANREDNKLSLAKKAVAELVKEGVLEKTSGYDKEEKIFKFEITEEYKGIMGLKSQIEYSKNQKEKKGRKKIGDKK